MVHHVKDEKDLEAKLKEAGNNLVVIDFFATWCGPCKLIAPHIETMDEEFPDVMFLKVDVDECEGIAAQYEISSMPTFVFIKNSKQLENFAGANAEKLKETVNKHK
uniref:Thioredoxin n=1 Tax=Graphocephala atropunctata TaxID=36148 RepID=Q1W2C2_9HEMI|nr:thioredoxin-like protein [Graphocephala atropunctata]